MCRMFAYLSTNHSTTTAASLDRSLGKPNGSSTRRNLDNIKPNDHHQLLRSLLYDFIELAQVGNVLPGKTEGHLDGWGLAFLGGNVRNVENNSNDTGGWTLMRSASPAPDPEHGMATAVEEALSSEPYQIVAHIRKASLGSIKMENSHPFLWRDKVFAHNGTVFKPEKFGEIDGLEGTTDSEKLFRYVMKELWNNDKGRSHHNNASHISTIDNARYMQILNDVKRVAGYTSLTAILAEPGRLLAYRDYNHKNSELRAKVLGDYYSLYFANYPEGLFICSEPIGDTAFGLEWKEIKDKHMVFARSDDRLKVGMLSQ